MTDLPLGWTTAPLRDVADVRLGRQRSPKHEHGDRMRPYLRAANVKWTGLDLADVKQMAFTITESKTYELQAGDLLLGEASGSPSEVGKPGQYYGQIDGCCFQNTLLRVRLPEGLSPDFYEHFFREQALNGRFAAGSRGVGIRHLGAAALSAWQVPIPSSAEQGRIVTAIEEAFSKLDAGEASLRAARQRLKRMRESVLAAAVTGCLVPQDPTDTPAAKLLADLGAESSENSFNALPNLPTTWVWTPLGSIASMSLGKMLDSKTQTGENPHAYVRNINVRWFSFRMNDLAVMDVRPDEVDRVSVADGDLVVCEGGQPGRCAVWRGPPMVIQKALHRVRPSPGILSDYLAIVLSWWAARPDYERFITGTTIKHIPKEKLRILPIPLPSSEEQIGIVAEVERQFSFIEACERTVDAAFVRAAALRRSILKCAFEGHLVPQDRADEPASALLERIRNDRAQAAPTANGGRRRAAMGK